MVASGFSQKTGLPALIAAVTYSSWVGPQEQTSTASTFGSAMTSWPVAWARGGAEPFGHLPGAGTVGVGDRDDLRAGQHSA